MGSLVVPIIGLAWVGLVMYLANTAEVTHDPFQMRALHWLLYSMIGIIGLSGVFLLQTTAGQGTVVVFQNVSRSSALAAFGFVSASCLIGVLVVARVSLIHRLISRAAIWGSYDPESLVHTTAVVLMLMLLSVLVINFVVLGGTSGLAEDLQNQSVSIGEPALTALVEISAAFLGVGYAIRRTLPQSLARLGLQLPLPSDLVIGVGAGLGLYLGVVIFSRVWGLFMTENEIKEQMKAAQQLALTFDTLPLALLVSASAAFGEEILMRGALQPMFGLVTTAVFFALLHTQYFVTPGLLLIFLVGLGLGWVRLRYSTSAAIVAHFVYNFIQLLLLILVSSAGSLP